MKIRNQNLFNILFYFLKMGKTVLIGSKVKKIILNLFLILAFEQTEEQILLQVHPFFAHFRVTVKIF